MGIVNVTPDSFSDGGDYLNKEDAIKHALRLEQDGADMLDIGAQSTRPGSTPISAQEEWQRLKSVLPELRSLTKLPLSVDTFYPEVAAKALACGVDIINDVSGTVSEKMAAQIQSSGAGWIIMHSGHATPAQVRTFFEQAAARCADFGIAKEQICFDMGIGFGKDYEENLALLANTAAYKLPDYPLLLGVSRKRVVGTASCQPSPKERVFGNIAADTAAIFGGVDIIRLHDVANEKQGILMAAAIKQYITE